MVKIEFFVVHALVQPFNENNARFCRGCDACHRLMKPLFVPSEGDGKHRGYVRWGTGRWQASQLRRW